MFQLRIGHFRVQFSLYFKASLRAKSLSRTSLLIHIEITANYYNNSFVLRLALKGSRLSETWKWLGAHQMEPAFPIQALGVNPFPSRFINRTIPWGGSAR